MGVILAIVILGLLVLFFAYMLSRAQNERNLAVDEILDLRAEVVDINDNNVRMKQDKRHLFETERRLRANMHRLYEQLDEAKTERDGAWKMLEVLLLEEMTRNEKKTLTGSGNT